RSQSSLFPYTTLFRSFYLAADGTLTTTAPDEPGEDAFESDPARPVPLVGSTSVEGMPADYMAADQRFAAERDDVLVYVSAPLDRSEEHTSELQSRENL